MNTIILGFTDKDGKGSAALVAGPEVSPSEQNTIMHTAKTHKGFPKGVVRLDQFTLNPVNTAIEIKPTKTSKKD